jgi:hypothetical protein
MRALARSTRLVGADEEKAAPVAGDHRSMADSGDLRRRRGGQQRQQERGRERDEEEVQKVRLLTRNTHAGSVWTEEVEVGRKVHRSSQMPRRNGEIEGEKRRLGSIPCRGGRRRGRRVSWCSQLGEGATTAAAPWLGRGGVVQCRWGKEEKGDGGGTRAKRRRG